MIYVGMRRNTACQTFRHAPLLDRYRLIPDVRLRAHRSRR
jgi:hypothetical protein